jgi:alpha-tubulin suppressor-like RCC1 family protein
MKLRYFCLWVAIGGLASTVWPVAGAAAPNKSPIAAGAYHTLAIQKDGSLWAWGDNYMGELGIGSADNNPHFKPARVGNATNWVGVAAGGGFSLGLQADGSLYAWGYNGAGQLALSDTNYPYLTPTLAWTNCVAVAAGGAHSLGLQVISGWGLYSGLYSWGSNSFGQLGLGGSADTNPHPTPTLVGTGWGAVAAGMNHSLGLHTDGSLWAWGWNFAGQLGIGGPPQIPDTDPHPTPAQVGTDQSWVAVAAGGAHSLGLKFDGSLWAWGSNSNGQLGLGDTDRRNIPTQVGTDYDWVAVTAGMNHSLGLKSNGSLWAWGSNSNGQLGLLPGGIGGGDSDPHPTPIQVAAPPGWVAVTAGYYHSLGLKADGSLWAWGGNDYGQLGMELPVNRTGPAQVKNFQVPQRAVVIPLF